MPFSRVLQLTSHSWSLDSVNELNWTEIREFFFSLFAMSDTLLGEAAPAFRLRCTSCRFCVFFLYVEFLMISQPASAVREGGFALQSSNQHDAVLLVALGFLIFLRCARLFFKNASGCFLYVFAVEKEQPSDNQAIHVGSLVGVALRCHNSCWQDTSSSRIVPSLIQR